LKVLTRYILKEFLSPFLLSMLLFCVIILVVTVLDQLKFIMDHRAGFLLACKYFALQVPFLVLQITPLAVLFAVLFSLGSLSKGSELIAMRAGGVDIFRVTKPLVAAGLVVCVLCVILNETLVPRTKSWADRVKAIEIEKKPIQKESVRWRVSMRGGGNRMYHLDQFQDGAVPTMRGVLLLEFGQGIRVKSRVDAKEGRYENKQWTLYDGWQRAFNEDGNELMARHFDKLTLPLEEKPSDFLAEQKEARELNMAELIAYINQLKKNGADYQKELVELHLKVSFPFACVVLVLLGVPTGWGLGKWSSVATSTGICLLVAFGYVGLIRVGQALGESGVLSPFIAGWIANFIFTCIGIWLLVKKNR
jgi:lipopolysaccharide export system permease protein